MSSSFVPFASCLQSFSASGSFPMSQLFVSDGQSIGASVLPMNVQDWFPSELTGLILQSNHICYSVCKVLILISCFQNFLFIEVCLSVVEYAMHRYEFLCKYPPWYLLLFSNLYIYVFYQIWETFGCHKSSFIALLPFIPHFFLWKSNYTCLACFNIVPPVPQSLFPPSPSVFFFPTLFFRLHYFCIFKFSDSSVISNLAFRVTQKQSNVVFPIYWIFLLQALYFLVLEFSFGYFIVFLCWDFLSVHYFKHLLI